MTYQRHHEQFQPAVRILVEEDLASDAWNMWLLIDLFNGNENHVARLQNDGTWTEQPEGSRLGEPSFRFTKMLMPRPPDKGYINLIHRRVERFDMTPLNPATLQEACNAAETS